MRIALLFVLLIAGCGYQFSGGELPGNVQRLYVPLARNLTAEPLIENILALPVTAVLARQKGVDIVEDPTRADAILQAVITKYSVEPLSYNSTDRISVLYATLVVSFSLVDSSDGRLLWQGTIERLESYQAAVDKNQQEDFESVAIETMAKNIADDLISRLVTKF